MYPLPELDAAEPNFPCESSRLLELRVGHVDADHQASLPTLSAAMLSVPTRWLRSSTVSPG